MNPGNDPELNLPPTDSLGHQSAPRSLMESVFGGETVERRPMMLVLLISMIVLSGFILGTLLTLAIVKGWIQLDLRTIKNFFKSITGRS